MDGTQNTAERLTAATEHVETVIVGGGQAGLCVGYHLGRLNRPFVILDAHERVGDGWRRQWDSLRLYSPARYDGLPGMSFPGPRWAFPTKDQVGDYLEAYAERFDLPVRHGVRVRRIEKNGQGYLLDCGDHDIQADNVVVASGTFGAKGYRPSFAGDLDPSIVQMHSSEYRRTTQLQPGAVLVVGASHSGADIALDVAGAHRTILSGRDTGQIPFPIESRRARLALPILWFLAGRVLTTRTPVGRKMRPEIRTHGGPLLRVKAEHLAAAGVERVTERTAGVRDGLPYLDGGRVLDVANVIWCTGFRQEFSWIRLPIAGDDSWPLEDRGVVPSAPGLYFAGLAFQQSFRSMLIGGAGKDAEHVARHIASRHVQMQGRATRPSAASTGVHG